MSLSVYPIYLSILSVYLIYSSSLSICLIYVSIYIFCQSYLISLSMYLSYLSIHPICPFRPLRPLRAGPLTLAGLVDGIPMTDAQRYGEYLLTPAVDRWVSLWLSALSVGAGAGAGTVGAVRFMVR